MESQDGKPLKVKFSRGWDRKEDKPKYCPAEFVRPMRGCIEVKHKGKLLRLYPGEYKQIT